MNDVIFTKDPFDSLIDFNFRLAAMYYDTRIPQDESLFFVSIAQSNIKEFIENKLSSSDRIDHYIENIQDLCDMISLYSTSLNKFMGTNASKCTVKPDAYIRIEEYEFDCNYLMIYPYGDRVHYIPYKEKVYEENGEFFTERDRIVSWLGDTIEDIYDIKLIQDKSMPDPDTQNNQVAAIMCSTNKEAVLDTIREAFKLSKFIPVIQVTDNYLHLGALYRQIIKSYKAKGSDIEPYLDLYQSLNVNEDVKADLNILDQRDILVYTPYMSYKNVLEYMNTIAESKDIQYIFQTVYRLNDEDSAIVKILSKAARMGKKVYVIIEERARGNEYSNYKYARKLIQAGCHVIANNSSKKIHSKLFCAVGDNHKQYAILSTGNFNEKTTTMYTDMHYLTSNEVIVRSLIHLVNTIVEPHYKMRFYEESTFNDHLFVSPYNTKSQLIHCIHEQAARGKAGKIFIKCNNLDDRDIVEAIMNAADAGCEIRILVRTICTIVADDYPNIIIKTKIGQFLEHDRVYIFGDNQEVYIGSADLMTRNLDNRIETLLHIKDQSIANQVIKIFQMNWYDVDHLIDPSLDKQFSLSTKLGDEPNGSEPTPSSCGGTSSE